MKKLLLLFIPLVLFFGCEPDDDNSSLTYNCIDDDCFAEEGGQYATLNDCISVCENNNEESNDTASWSWIITTTVDSIDLFSSGGFIFGSGDTIQVEKTYSAEGDYNNCASIDDGSNFGYAIFLNGGLTIYLSLIHI